MSDTVNASIREVIPTNKNASCIVQQQINDSVEIIKVERRKYLVYKILCDVILQCVSGTESNLREDVREKVMDVFLREDVAETVDLGNGLTLLGLAVNNEKTNLNYEEISLLKNAVEQQLPKTAGIIIQRVKMCNLTEMDPSLEDKLVSDFKSKLNVEKKLYTDSLTEEISYLSEIVKLRTDVLPNISSNKMQEFELSSKLNRLKSKFLYEKTRVDIFTETPKSVQAYQEFVRDVLVQKEECKKEIKDLQLLREKYKQIQCKEYDSILKSYLQHKSCLEKRQFLYEQMKHK